MFKTIQLIVLAALCLNFSSKAQEPTKPPSLKNHAIIGKVISATTGEALPGAVIKITYAIQTVLANDKGEFILSLPNGNYKIAAHYLSYQPKTINIQIPLKEPLVIQLETNNNDLKEVEIVSTGYQTINRELTTGSFVQIDKELLNRRVSTNVLDRINDVAPGVYFTPADPQLSTISKFPSAKNSGIIIRGESTFSGSKEPLIILDDFPYEGEIKNINPNDIESITVLKDASSASIWGARSANGVIVLTTKKGKLNQKMKIALSSNFSTIEKPDLNYSPRFLAANNFIEVEQFLFDKDFFNAQLNNTSSFPTVSPAVELMAKHKAATTGLQRLEILNELNKLSQIDVREDYSKYVYQKASNYQQSLGITGGNTQTSYGVSFGLDKNNNNLIRNDYKRTTINANYSYRPLKNLEILTGINYSQNAESANNGFGFGSYTGTGSPYGSIFPYSLLADENGNALPVLQGIRNPYLESTRTKGFLDWNYRPLDEITLADNVTKLMSLLLKTVIKYQFIPQLNVQLNYQREVQKIEEQRYRSQDTYEARNLINRFSSYNASTGLITYIFPLGGILDLQNTNWETTNLRGQFNYSQSFGKHNLTGMLGAEVREFVLDGYGRTSYGYNDQVGTSVANLNYGLPYTRNPSGSAFIPAPSSTVNGNLNRNISYYSLANYNYDHKYTLNLSVRQDGANLFGAKVNDKIQPFLSAGLGWHLSNEPFYKLQWLPYLRLRATYGYQGNTNQSSTAYLTGNYSTDENSGAPVILITTAPNPRLKWENVKVTNLALDFKSKTDIIRGNIEFYQKDGQDLIQPTLLATQTGFNTYQANTATTKTKGVDITLESQNVNRKLKWSTVLLFSQIKDKVIRYDAPRTSASVSGAGGPSYAAGKPLDALFSYKWAGLNPENGNPRGYLNGVISENYNGIINNFNTDSLIYNGSRVPTIYGAFRNDFSYNGFSLSINLSYRLGYVFRRSTTSLNYTNIIQSGQHSDYTLRWQQSGDEKTTSVPSLVYPANNNRNAFYQSAEVLVESGDHIRLQDIRFSYDFPGNVLQKMKMSRLSLFAYVNNLGILWRKNKAGIDPSAVGNSLNQYPTPLSTSIGLTVNF